MLQAIQHVVSALTMLSVSPKALYTCSQEDFVAQQHAWAALRRQCALRRHATIATPLVGPSRPEMGMFKYFSDKKKPSDALRPSIDFDLAVELRQEML